MPTEARSKVLDLLELELKEVVVRKGTVKLDQLLPVSRRAENSRWWDRWPWEEGCSPEQPGI